MPFIQWVMATHNIRQEITSLISAIGFHISGTEGLGNVSCIQIDSTVKVSIGVIIYPQIILLLSD